MLALRPLASRDIEPIAEAFLELGWNKPASQYEGYLEESARGARSIVVATFADAFCGYVTLKSCADYGPFRQEGIPEIQDFNVLPRFRRRGIGSRLMDEAERLAAAQSDRVGLGVALDPDYGPAQRLYVLKRVCSGCARRHVERRPREVGRFRPRRRRSRDLSDEIARGPVIFGPWQMRRRNATPVLDAPLCSVSFRPISTAEGR